MGGFLLQTPDEDEPQPLNGELLSLIQRGYLSYPNLGKAVIDDKNKFDGLARYVLFGKQRPEYCSEWLSSQTS